MKYILRTILALALLAGPSCTRDQGAGGREGDGVPVTITVETGTRSGNDPEVTGIHYGSDIDSRIDVIRMLGYRASDGSLAFNKTVAIDPGQSDPEAGYIYGTIEVMTGLFDFVFIANETSDDDLSLMLKDAEHVGTFEKLMRLSFDIVAFDENTPIPMVTVVERVAVLGDNRLDVPGQVPVTDVWKVGMERLAIRIELELTMADSFAAGAKLTFDKVPQSVYLIRNENIVSTDTYDRSACLSDTEANGDGTTTLTWERIILPESWFEDAAKEENGLVVRLTSSGDMKQATLGIDPGTDYRMPRNYYYYIYGQVRDGGQNLDITLEAKDWDKLDPEWDPHYISLNVSAIKASITERNMARIYFSTDQPADSISVLPATPADAIFTGLTDGSQWNLNFDPATGQGYIDIMTDEEAGAAEGKYTILLKSAGLKRAIDVDVRIAGYPLWEYCNYVGAFWQAYEVGERVIMMPNNDQKAWTASVEYSPEPGTPTGWVKIAAGKSPDPNYYTDKPGDAENFPVEKDEVTVSGEEHIWFRLGCTGPNTGAAPRYARVKIVWDGVDNEDTNHYIYLRQGEQDDYLMRPSDPATTWTGSGRPLAAKYSPYNLTSQEFLDGTKTGGPYLSGHSKLGGSGTKVDEERTYSTFTKYPTHTGAYMSIWAADETYARIAWYPHDPLGKIVDWYNTQLDNDVFWDDIKDTHEVCPKGYRMPNNGPTDDKVWYYDTFPIEQSEMSQSLFVNPVTDMSKSMENSLWGYYADGYFDRRPIEDEPHHISWGYPYTTVYGEGQDYAVAGALMFNPENFAALFFPASGSRTENNISFIGMSGNYPTTATQYGTGTSQGIMVLGFSELHLAGPQFSLAYVTQFNGNALSVRCVLDE